MSDGSVYTLNSDEYWGMFEIQDTDWVYSNAKCLFDQTLIVGRYYGDMTRQ